MTHEQEPELPWGNGVDYELWKDVSTVMKFYGNIVGRDLPSYDRLQYAMRRTGPDKEPYMFFYVMRRVSEHEEVGHWVTSAGNRVDDATEEELNDFCELLRDEDGPYGSINSETGFWET